MTKPQVFVEIADEQISLGDKQGEIVMWSQNEWLEDPALVTVAIARYLQMLYEEGPDAVRDLVGHWVTPAGEEYWRRNEETNAMAHRRVAMDHESIG
jgi:hypothetical protein